MSSAPFKGKGTSGVSDANMNPSQDDGWEVYGKKSKGRGVAGNAPKQGGTQSSTRAWGHPDTAQKLGMRSTVGSGRGSNQSWPTQPPDSRKQVGRGYAKPQLSKGPDSNYVAAPPVIPPPLRNGWGWTARAGSSQSPQHTEIPDDHTSKVEIEEDDEESDDALDDSDDDFPSDDFDSDGSEKSHETKKKNNWFRELFQSLDSLTVEQINEPERQWHCPACRGGPGAIDWYRGLQPLITHAKTKRSKRVKLHRELASLLDEELRRRGTSAVPAGETFGQWKGLGVRADREIVWPPMVIIMNTRLDKDDDGKWTGMGNPELLDYFSAYAPVRARHSYGPQGHRGMSLLIFEQSAVGYAEAERLSRHFEDLGRDRNAWGRCRLPLYSGGKRELFGYMAEKQDMDAFNQHCQGKSKLKYEMRSYQEMVVDQMKQMSEENQQLLWFKQKAAKEQMNKKALEQSVGIMAEKLRQTMEENRIVKLRTKKQHEQNQEEMDYQEQFFREQIEQLYKARNDKEDEFEKSMQDELEKVTNLSEANGSSVERHCRDGEVKLHDKEKAYVSKRDELMQALKVAKLELQRRHQEEEMALEKEFDEKFNKLIEDYTPSGSKQSGHVGN